MSTLRARLPPPQLKSSLSFDIFWNGYSRFAHGGLLLETLSLVQLSADSVDLLGKL